MANQIVFGSAEANQILAKNKELERIAREEAAEKAKRNSPKWIEDRIEEVESEIGAMEVEIAMLHDELGQLYDKQRKQRHSNDED